MRIEKASKTILRAKIVKIIGSGTAADLLSQRHARSSALRRVGSYAMIGAICGDIIGSVHEGAGTKTKHFPLFVPQCRFTDDTVLTVAVAARLLHGGDYVDLFHAYFHAYPHAGYGGTFIEWARQRRRQPYRSWGNGAAMRVSPVGIAYDSLDDVMAEARRSAEVTHDHPEGIRGAQATATAVYLARTDASKPDIRACLERTFGYDLSQKLNDIRDGYRFDISCQGSVPQSIVAFLESDSYEDAVRNAISLGGDADTMAAIAGGIAEAFYGGVPEPIRVPALDRLDRPLRAVVDEFMGQFGERLTGRRIRCREAQSRPLQAGLADRHAQGCRRFEGDRDWTMTSPL